MSRRWLFVLAALLCMPVLYASGAKWSINRERSAASTRVLASSASGTLPVLFVPYQGEHQACDLSRNSESGTAIPESTTVGDALQLTVAFSCSYSSEKIADLRNDSMHYKPMVSAVDFDVDPAMGESISARAFYCVHSPADAVCAKGGLTPEQDLRWTWILRPKSAGRHVVRIEIDQVEAAGSHSLVTGRLVYPYQINVRASLFDDLNVSLFSAFAALVTAICGLPSLAVFVRGGSLSRRETSRVDQSGKASPPLVPTDAR